MTPQRGMVVVKEQEGDGDMLVTTVSDARIQSGTM